MREKTSHKVFNPVLTDEEIQDLTSQLGGILAGYVPEDRAEDSDTSVDASTSADESADEGQSDE